MNAQRVSLGRILGLPCMRRYLKYFKWETEEAQELYFEVLETLQTHPDKLETLWESLTGHRRDFESAILLCMRALSMTGHNHKDLLDVLFCSEATARPELVSLTPKRHT